MIKELQQLSSAEADANGMRKCLESCEYTVEPVLIDPTSKEVKDAVQEMQSTTQSGDHIVVFYSGHAKRIFEQESGALQLGMKDKWLLFSTITNKLQRAEAATVTVFLDCCCAADWTRDSIRGSDPFNARGIAVLCASWGKEAAYEDTDQGLFTRLLLKALASTDNPTAQGNLVTFRHVNDYVSNRLYRV